MKVPLEPGRWLVEVSEEGFFRTRLDDADRLYPDVRLDGANRAFDEIRALALERKREFLDEVEAEEE